MFGLPPLSAMTEEQREEVLGTKPRPRKAAPTTDLDPFWVGVGRATAYVVVAAVVLMLLWALFD